MYSIFKNLTVDQINDLIVKAKTGDIESVKNFVYYSIWAKINKQNYEEKYKEEAFNHLVKLIKFDIEVI